MRMAALEVVSLINCTEEGNEDHDDMVFIIKIASLL